MIDALARRVLESPVLEDKLAPWGPIGTAGRGASVPDVPARSDGWAFGASGLRPDRVDLTRTSDRDALLLALANHELQAIELLASALLRFPDAPEGLRRSWAATLSDEQRHCRMYLSRLEGPAEGACSAYFWNTLGRVGSPEAFLAGLSLCFESANLDFCQHWAERFDAIGDTGTTAVLRAVYADEIRHVGHGLAWFGRLGHGDRVERWKAALPAPLTPSRSRGPRFDREGRLAAGWEEDEVDRLRIVGGSRGRPPRVLVFDAGVEEAMVGPRTARSREVGAALASLPMFLVADEDVVIAPEPDVRFLGKLADAGFAIPRFSDRDGLGPHPVRRVEPWGPVPDGGLADIAALEPMLEWDEAWRSLSDKRETLRRAATLVHPARVRQVGRVWDAVGDPGEGPWVVKAPFSASGTGRIRGRGPLTPPQRRWIETRLARFGSVLWQPWYARLVDVSVHVTVGPDVRIDGITRFETRANGVFAGTWLGRWTAGLEPEVARMVHTRDVSGALRGAAHVAGTWAAELGFRGPLSIDAAIVREGGELRVHPWLETNARRTLGRVGLALQRRVHGRSRGWWRVARATPELRERLGAGRVVLRDGRVAQGVLPTTDPAAHPLCTWLEVEESRGALTSGCG